MTVLETPLVKLAEAGVALVRGTYYGSGDDGSIDEIEFVNDTEQALALPAELTQEVDWWLNDLMFANGVDFNNAGSSGSFRVFVTDRRVEFDHREHLEESTPAPFSLQFETQEGTVSVTRTEGRRPKPLGDAIAEITRMREAATSEAAKAAYSNTLEVLTDVLIGEES